LVGSGSVQLGQQLSMRAFICVGKNAKPSRATHPPLIHPITLNLNISGSRQDIKILFGRF